MKNYINSSLIYHSFIILSESLHFEKGNNFKIRFLRKLTKTRKIIFDGKIREASRRLLWNKYVGTNGNLMYVLVTIVNV